MKNLLRRWRWRNRQQEARAGRASSGHLDPHERNAIFQRRKRLPR